MPDNRTCRAETPGGEQNRYSDRRVDGKSPDDAVSTVTGDGLAAKSGEDPDALPNARSRAELEGELGAARQADRMKSVLLSTVCHELRTPLTTIKGFTNVLMDYGDELEQPEKHEFLAGIDEASDRLGAMIDNLLAFSSLDAGMPPMWPIPTRVDEVVGSAVAQLGLRARGRPITLIVPPKLPMAMADADGLCQVLDNLLVNALKYTPTEAGIRVECSESTHDGKPALRICVQDEGPGIPEDQLEGIFQPFYQLDQPSARQVGGVGLGLAICRKIVDAHGGQIWAESTLGRGATFVITLPVATPMSYYESRSDGRRRPQAPESPPASNERSFTHANR